MELKLARLENENQQAPLQIQTQQFDLNRLLRNMLALATMQAQAKNQTISLDSDSEKPIFVVGRNEALIGSLLRNLLDNAVRYSPQGSVVDVTLNADSFIVRDNGPGVTPEALARIGERFYRPPGQTATGSGLGLSIVQRIAKLHDMNVEFGNAEQGGFEAKVSW